MRLISVVYSGNYDKIKSVNFGFALSEAFSDGYIGWLMSERILKQGEIVGVNLSNTNYAECDEKSRQYWLRLSVRAKNAMKSAGYSDGCKIASISIEHLRGLPGVGENTLGEIESAATACGICLIHSNESIQVNLQGLSVRAKNVLSRARIDINDPSTVIHLNCIENTRGAGKKVIEEIIAYAKSTGRQVQIELSSRYLYEAATYSNHQDKISVSSDFSLQFAKLSVRAQKLFIKHGGNSYTAISSMPSKAFWGHRGIGNKTLREVEEFWKICCNVDKNIESEGIDTKVDPLLELDFESADEFFDQILKQIDKVTYREIVRHAPANLPELLKLAESSISNRKLVGLAQAIHERRQHLETGVRLSNPQKLASKAAENNLTPDDFWIDSHSVLGSKIQRILESNALWASLFVYKFQLKPQRETLDDVAKKVKLSRQRTHQLLNKMLNHIESYPGLLKKIISDIQRETTAHGGVIDIFEIECELLGNGASAKSPFVKFLAETAAWPDNLRIDGSAIMDTTAEILSNETLSRIIYDASLRVASVRIGSNHWCSHIDDVATEASKLNQGINSKQYAGKISEVTIKRVLSAPDSSLIVQDRTVYTREFWALKFGTLSAKAESVLLIEMRSMHHSEIVSVMSSWSETKDHNFRAGIDRSPDLLLWGHGVYIHRNCVEMPHALLREIAIWVEEQLSANVPYFSVAKAFEHYRYQCQDRNIPTRQALYSCLRLWHDTRLAFPEYPWIRRKEVDSERKSILTVIEEFVEQAGGPVPRSELSKFLIDDLGSNPAIIQTHILNTPNLIFGRDVIIHNANLNFDIALLDELVQYCLDRLKNESVISVQSIISKRKVVFVRTGIKDAKLLHSVLVYFSRGALIGTYPNISRQEDGIGSNSVVDLIVEYLRDASGPCSMASLRNHFVEIMGYNERVVSSIANHKKVVRVALGVFTNIERLEWNNEKSERLVLLAEAFYLEERKSGKLTVSIADFLEHSEDILPSIGVVSWTKSLLQCLMKRSNHFVFWGIGQDLFVPKDGATSPSSISEVTEKILLDEFRGVCILEECEQRLRELGVIQRNLRPNMLGDDSRVEIRSNTVAIRGVPKC